MVEVNIRWKNLIYRWHWNSCSVGADVKG